MRTLDMVEQFPQNQQLRNLQNGMFWPFWHHCFLARPFLSIRSNENLNPFDIPTVPLCRLSWSACTIVLWVAKCCLSKQRQITMPSHGRPNEKPKPKVYNMLNVLVLAVTFWHDWVCPSWILQRLRPLPQLLLILGAVQETVVDLGGLWKGKGRLSQTCKQG